MITPGSEANKQTKQMKAGILSRIIPLLAIFFGSCEKEEIPDGSETSSPFGPNRGRIYFYVTEQINGAYISNGQRTIYFNTYWADGFGGDCSDTLRYPGFTLPEGYHDFYGGSSEGDRYNIRLYIKSGQCRDFSVD